MAIHDLFRVHKLNAQGFVVAEQLAQHFSDVATLIESTIPPGRERSLALTHLQQASMHAKRGIAEVKENQLQEG